MVQVRVATGATRVVWMAVVLRCGKQMEKLPHYHFSWIVSFQIQRYHVCEILGYRRGYSHLKEEALDCIKWRNRFGRGCGPVVWQITDYYCCCCCFMTICFNAHCQYTTIHTLCPLIFGLIPFACCAVLC
jgi:hypothetical protein